jgi:hypothetical protein
MAKGAFYGMFAALNTFLSTLVLGHLILITISRAQWSCHCHYCFHFKYEETATNSCEVTWQKSHSKKYPCQDPNAGRVLLNTRVRPYNDTKKSQFCSTCPAFLQPYSTYETNSPSQDRSLRWTHTGAGLCPAVSLMCHSKPFLWVIEMSSVTAWPMIQQWGLGREVRGSRTCLERSQGGGCCLPPCGQAPPSHQWLQSHSPKQLAGRFHKLHLLTTGGEGNGPHSLPQRA